MKLFVDPSLCQGHGRCLALAPEVFDFDEDSFKAVARPTPRLMGTQPDQIRAALLACPEQAISLIDDTEVSE